MSTGLASSSTSSRFTASEVLHLLDDDAHERSRIRRRSADELRVRGLECIRAVEVLDHEVLFDLGGFLQKPYEFEIGVGEILLYRGKPVSLGESLAWTRGDSKHGDTSKQRAARDAVAFHVQFPRNLFPSISNGTQKEPPASSRGLLLKQQVSSLPADLEGGSTTKAEGTAVRGDHLDPQCILVLEVRGVAGLAQRIQAGLLRTRGCGGESRQLEDHPRAVVQFRQR